MCGDCGCAEPVAGARIDGQPLAVAGRLVARDLAEPLHAANAAVADAVRADLARRGLRAVNLMSAPGSGKTALLEATARHLAGRFRLGVVEGDLATDRDAARLRRLGVPAVQVTTGSACHLDATLVAAALPRLPLATLDLVVVENVGNLVCPAAFDVGAHARVVLLAVTEGDDKPAKYPLAFRTADLVVITKADLAPACDDFVVARAEACVRELGNTAPVLVLSARSGAGLDAWCRWLTALRAAPAGPATAAAAP